jgi:hypothetical protein
MGYCTDYTLSYDWWKVLALMKEELKSPNEISLEERLEYALDEESASGYKLKHFVNGNADSCKWYEHDEDMTALSKQFPTVMFTLKGEGEESGDLWVAYYLGGKSYRDNAEIVFPEFSEEKLK